MTIRGDDWEKGGKCTYSLLKVFKFSEMSQSESDSCVISLFLLYSGLLSVFRTFMESLLLSLLPELINCCRKEVLPTPFFFFFFSLKAFAPGGCRLLF